jgi:[ribosomal protein S5]-alanine N-acetyltransferase
MLVKGPQVHLRTVRAADLDQLYLFTCDVDARGPHFPIFFDSESGFRHEFEQGGFLKPDSGTLLICDHADRLLGVMYFFKATPYFAGYEIGYRLFDLENSRHGIMTEALLLCSYLLFAWKTINRLELKIFPENSGSKRVAQKCGYQYEGLLRGCDFHRGQYHDMESYSLLRHEAPHSLAEVLACLAALNSAN